MGGRDGVEGRAARARSPGSPTVVPAPVPALVPRPPGLVDHARAAAARAALDAGVEVDELRGLGRLREMVELFGEVWGAEPESMLPLATARALQHAGNYTAGAVDRDGGHLVGAIIGMFGLRAGRLLLHSHIAGVRPPAQGRAVGFALKQHQRAWALAAGVGTVEWTFDPLVRRNTYFNVTKLGVRVAAYHPDFYGPMADALNAGEPTDRCVARWDLASPAAVAAAGGAAAEPDRAALLAGGATVVLDEAPDGTPRAWAPTRGTLLAWVPADVVALRARAPQLAHSWRLALRATLERALGGGHALTGATRDGWYVLTEEADVRSRS
jgi:predicted GNAT superfamily acetyltransferase